MDTVGYAALQIIPSFKGLDRQLEQGTSKGMLAAGTKGGARFGDAAGKSAGHRFSSVFSSAAKASVLGLVGAGALAFKVGKDSLALASDLNESQNAVTVTYGKQAAAVKKLGADAADSLGLSNAEFNSLAVRFSSFSETIAGSAGKKVVGTLDELTTRASDFASVMNLEVNESAELFQSGLAGETEPLRKFGIDLSAAKVQAFAYAEGIAKSGKELSEGEKVQARYGLLLKQTAKTQGDFVNTSDSAANQQRILNARWDDARAKLGTALLPALTDVTGFLLDEGVPAFEKATDFFTNDFGPAVHDLAGDLKPVAGALGDTVKFLNDLPSGAKLAALAGVVGGGAALKLRGGKGGLLGTAGSALGISKPVPVFVTNPGFGGGAGVGGGGKGGVAGGSTAKSAARFFLPFLLGEVAYEGVLDDGFGMYPKSPPPTPQQRAAAPFGAGLQAPGVGKAAEDFLNFGKIVDGVMSGVDTTTRTALARVKASFDTLPGELKTDIVVNGGPETRSEVRELVRTYDLTPKEKRTLMKVFGIGENERAMKEYIGVLKGAEGPRNSTVSVFGIESARAAVHALTIDLNNLPGNIPINVQTSIQGGGGGGGGGGGNNGRRRPRGQVPSRGHDGYGVLERMMDERIAGQRGLDDQRRRSR